MAAFNIVRMRVKPGRGADFLNLHREMSPSISSGMSGMRRALIVKTGERSYCLIGEWDSFDSIVSARAEMVGSLDRMRDLLEDLGVGLGVTDPISGEVVLELRVSPARHTRLRQVLLDLSIWGAPALKGAQYPERMPQR